MPGSPFRIQEQAFNTYDLFNRAGYGHLFEIRPPQRRFKWAAKEVRQLWGDVLNAHKSNRQSYFLGTLIVTPLSAVPQKVSVLDGQQRIATLSLLLAVLRDCCNKYQDEAMEGWEGTLTGWASTLQELVTRLGFDRRPLSDLVVTLQDGDKDTFIELVKQPRSTDSVSEPSNKREWNSKHLLTQAVGELKRLLRQHLDTFAENGVNKRRELVSLGEFIISKLHFFVVEVASEAEGYLVFDTTNTRGLRLTPSEALKGRLATIAREDADLSQLLIEKWNRAATKLENARLPINAMDDYLHAIWSAQHGHMKKSDLASIAPKLDTPDKTKLREFVDEIDTCCDSYLAVLRPQGNSLLTEDLRDLRSLNVQCNSFLTMVHHHALNHFEEAVNLVLSLQIRNVTIGNDRPGEYEKEWPTWAVKVRNGGVQEAFQEIRNKMYSDESFRENFRQISVTSASTARHLLRRLDPISRPGSGVRPFRVDVEHVLPQTVVGKLIHRRTLTSKAKQWIQDLGFSIPETPAEQVQLGGILAASLNKMGNRALFDGSTNRGVKDQPFGLKREFYRQQALELTKELAETEQWTLWAIQERQERLADRAPSAWPK